jgi:hypothetical protein
VKETTYRSPEGMRCVWLDPDAKRCRKPAYKGVQFHGNPEWDSRWVIAYFCRAHLDAERD